MKKIKAASLVVTLVAFLSLMSFATPKFGYFFVSPAVPGQNTNCLASLGCLGPSGISYIGSGLVEVPRARPGSNGLDRYFNFLVAAGAFNLAAF